MRGFEAEKNISHAWSWRLFLMVMMFVMCGHKARMI